MWNQEGIPLLWRGQGLRLSIEFGQKSAVWRGQGLRLSAEFGQKSAVWRGQGLWLSAEFGQKSAVWEGQSLWLSVEFGKKSAVWRGQDLWFSADNKGGFQHYSWFSMFFFDFPFFKSSYFAFNLDPFDEFRCILVFLNIFFKAKLHWNEKNEKCVFHVLRNKNRWSSHEKVGTFKDFVSSCSRK